MAILEKAVEMGARNKIVPGWLRAVLVLPFVAGGIVFMVYLGNVYYTIAKIQASWFDGSYYLVLTLLLTILVYLLILVVSLIPGLLLTNLARRSYEKKLPKEAEQPYSTRD